MYNFPELVHVYLSIDNMILQPAINFQKMCLLSVKCQQTIVSQDHFTVMILANMFILFLQVSYFRIHDECHSISS